MGLRYSLKALTVLADATPDKSPSCRTTLAARPRTSSPSLPTCTA